MKTELQKFYDLIDDLETAMMTTRRADGHLRARAMANQKRAAGADLWFVTADDTAKTVDLGADPHLNLSYFQPRTRAWVSVSGIGTLSKDRETIHALYAPDWKIWFPAAPGIDDDVKGTADDPRIVLIGVQIHAAEFLEIDKPSPVILYEMVKGWLTGTEPDLGRMHELTRPHR